MIGIHHFIINKVGQFPNCEIDFLIEKVRLVYRERTYNSVLYEIHELMEGGYLIPVHKNGVRLPGAFPTRLEDS